MNTNAKKGAYFKARSKRYLESKGFVVGDLELVRWIYKDGRPAFATKRDQFASDLLAVSAKNVIFVQSKGGVSAGGGTFPAARRKFAEYQFPPWVRCWVMAWPPRASVPRIVECQGAMNGKASADGDRAQVDPCSESRRAEAAERIIAGT